MREGKWHTGLIPVTSFLDTYFSVGFLQYSGKSVLVNFLWVLFVWVFVWGFVCLVSWFFYIIVFTVSVVNEDRKTKLSIN